MRPIPQSGSFTTLREKNAVYVDKTECIHRLLTSYERVFISRPRRFGKSLTLDTIGTLFEKGVDPYFKGTWIYDKWTDATYPVFRINFLDLISDSYAEFTEKFCDLIQEFADDHEWPFKAKQRIPAVYIRSLLKSLGERKIVILIDEYDCMLTANMNDETEYTRYIKCFRAFYGALKDKPQVRFLAVTGVTRLKNVSIFSVGSDIRDLTYSHDMATVTGYTREEIRRNFGEYMADVIPHLYEVEFASLPAEARRMYEDQLLSRLASEYDGYCFDENYEQKVFSTWSVNTFFLKNAGQAHVSFGDYWFDNGGLPSILNHYLESHELDVTEYLGENIVNPDYTTFMNPTSLLTIPSPVLMCQTGYLTLRSELSSGTTLLLGIPNNEVRKALANLLYYKRTGERPDISGEQKKLLESGSGAEICRLFDALFNSMSYEKYPIDDEASLRSHLQFFFLGAGISTAVERENARGRSDLELDFPRRRVVIELKFVRDSAAAASALDDAVAQIKSRAYGDTLLLKTELVCLAMVFDGSPAVRSFVKFQEV